ncbi:hypothetical protein [Roseateles depolymerans]|uniref:Uncharacterized protein n=1 Tax=Roseateles depolymerans TaxID=76731 RepID=A0A0U3LJS3_9BURK|nr:hypothetical protein [Roseateles depolymerans]ALV06658.1 hypothetical protein RD2015_2186 [Roseateles depolymerans]REG19635.1 hypothetical protein DES44_2135 [Roseateles depolymerans]
MTDHITRLKEALEGVAPAGSWSRHGATVEIEESDEWARVTIQCRANKLINRKVAAYVAAANPDSIRELLAERQSMLEKLEQENAARRQAQEENVELKARLASQRVELMRELRGKMEQADKDARRWQWFCNNASSGSIGFSSSSWFDASDLRDGTASRIIDAAIASQEGGRDG